MRTLRRISLLSFPIVFFAAIPLVSFASLLPPQFTNPIPYDAGGNPSSVAVGDFNGDGHLDLVVSYWTGGGVGVLLGNGDGSFKPVVKYSSGDVHSYKVAVADVNGDGKMDIVVLNTYDQPGTVGVLLGNGDGSFQAAATYYTGDYSMPEYLAVGDLNGDGKPDIAVANFGHRDCDCNDGRIGLLWNKGDGTFQPIVFRPSGGYDTVFVMIKDGGLLVTNLCGDRYCDWPNGTVCWGGCYDSGGINPNSAALGDVNRDGYVDILVANSQGNGIYNPPSVGVLLNVYDGDFQKAIVYDAGGAPYEVAAADINGDRKLDAVVNYRSGIGVLLGRGAGKFGTAVKFGSIGAGLLAADVNADGKPDLVGTNAILLNITPLITTTSITSSLNPSFVGQSLTFTAIVNSNGGLIPDGELVTFYDNATVLSSMPLVGGVANYATSSLSGKTHTIKAYYGGDANFAASNASVKQQVLKYATTVSLSSAPNPSPYGQVVTFTASVTPSGPYAVTGRVKFWDGATAIGHAPVTGGVATLKKKGLIVGTHPITAQYMSDAYNDKSTSAVLNQVVQ